MQSLITIRAPHAWVTALNLVARAQGMKTCDLVRAAIRRYVSTCGCDQGLTAEFLLQDTHAALQRYRAKYGAKAKAPAHLEQGASAVGNDLPTIAPSAPAPQQREVAHA
jgi:hypothetical protein